MTDVLDQPVQCLKVASVRLRAKTILPRPVYDVDWQFQYRYLPAFADEAVVTGDGGEQFKRLGVAVDVLKGLLKDRWSMLDMAKFEHRSATGAKERMPVVPETPMSFRLHGIAEDGRGSLALTDRGVFGVGDSIGGCRIIKVEKDHIVVENKQGRREVVSLYRSEVNP